MKPSTRALVTVFLGPFGIHKFADRKIGMGFLYFFTMGLFGIGWIIDSCKAIFAWYTSNKSNLNHSAGSRVTYNLNQSYDSMDGHTFEHYCAELLTKNGFENVEVTKGSGDQGIDILAYKDDIKYGIQCKCYSSDIGNKAVQEAFAGKTFYNCHVAAVLTNRYFTKSAKELAETNQVLLWDREKLEQLAQNSYH